MKFPESLVITANTAEDVDLEGSHLQCYECKGRLEHEDKVNFLAPAKWVPQTQSSVRGFYVNQLYSTAITPVELARTFLKSMSDATAETEFYNSKLGLPHAVAGAQLNEDQIRKCIGGYRNMVTERIVTRNKLRTIGIDVGRWFHIVVMEWEVPHGCPLADINLYASGKVIYFGKVAGIADVDDKFRQFTCSYGIIDANPERRIAFDFANRWYGRVKMCIYARSVAARQLIPSKEQDQMVNCDRTSWLDMSLGRFRRQNAIQVPQDIDQEYIDQLKALVRVYLKDKDGNPVARYDTPEGKADHYAHAQNYAEIALAMSLGAGSSESIKESIS